MADLLPAVIRVMEGEKVIEVIYGNERSDVYKVDGIIIAVKKDDDGKTRVTRTYQITGVNIAPTEAGIDEINVTCIIKG